MKKNRFITGYSGLRALAVIGVILYHLDPNTFVGGYLGVAIFFVLSGYLVTDHMLRAYDESGEYDIKHFYLSRVKKLYPQLIAVLWLSAAYIVLFQRNLLVKLNQIVLANLLNVYNFWQILNGQSYFERFASNESPFIHLWTMSIEGQFYIIWPLVIFLMAKFVKKKKAIFGVLVTCSLISALEMAFLYKNGVDINRIYYGTDTRFFALGIGAALAVVWPVENLQEKFRSLNAFLLDVAGLFAFVGIAVLTFSKRMDPQAAFAYCGGMLLFVLLVTLLVGIIAHPASHWNRLLTNPLFNWIGSRSYGIYLYQFPVMIFFEDKLRDLADHVWLYRIIELIIILIISELSYRLIERPFGKISWVKTKNYFRQLFDRQQKNYLKWLQMLVVVAISLVGSAGILISPTVKAENFNKSQLAKRIIANRKEQVKDNQALIAKLKKEKQKTTKKAKIIKEAKKNAQKHPVNESFVGYGISQLDLQLAQKVHLTAVGDSVMAGSSNDLKILLPHALIDAAVSRQLNVAFNLLNVYQKQNALAANVLIGLGTNGPFSMADLNQLMNQLGKKRHVFWINVRVPTREWQGQVNDILAQAAKKYPNLTVIDWYGYSQAHQAWFYQDQTHPTPVGSKYYSAFVVKKIVEHAKF
ncbi:acyltransferase family protein [Lactobacillus sp. ESL0791]|uniref:acyltransferase family protein n=1 Tax=Lactobacillus sp. ESL0791 TaxID=2983234 RepID=UPI0023F90F65|nr:acyltransferase family protein [Lactobacillus sp. ESL0791]MDF7638855.1 acyltransferase family protein [Lactobacillus sp. ESL0791]